MAVLGRSIPNRPIIRSGVVLGGNPNPSDADASTAADAVNTLTVAVTATETGTATDAVVGVTVQGEIKRSIFVFGQAVQTADRLMGRGPDPYIAGTVMVVQDQNVSATETVTATETPTNRAYTIPETASGTDAGTVAASRTVTETASGTDAVSALDTSGTINKSATETGAAVDFAAAKGMTVSEAAGGTDAVSNLTGTSGSAPYVSDTFTGSDGEPWDATKWISGQRTSGATATKSGNAGRMGAGSIGGYDGKCSQKVNYANQKNAEILCDIRFKGGAGYDNFFTATLRGDSAADGGDGYQVRIHQGSSTWIIERVVSFSSVTIASSTFSFSDDTWYTIRFQAVDNSIKAKVWAAGSSEPASWAVTVTDTTITSAGAAFLTNLGGNTSGGYIDVDNFVFSDGSTSFTVTALETGSSTDSALPLAVTLSATETASGADVAGNQARAAQEFGSSTDLGQIAGTPIFAAETGSSLEAEQISVTIAAFEPVLLRDEGTVTVPPDEISDFDFIHGLDFPRRIGKGPYRLLLPWVEAPRADHRFFRRVSIHRGVSLLRIDGLFRLIEEPTIEQLLAADRIYLGGYDNWVTDEEAQDLGNAGWADYIEGFVYVPDSYYGSGQYGVSVYGN